MSVGIINKQIEERASLQKNFLKTANMLFGKDWNELTKEELYQTLVRTVRQYISENWIMTNKYYEENQCKEVYYFSIEFLLGRLLNTNLINLDMKEICKEARALPEKAIVNIYSTTNPRHNYEIAKQAFSLANRGNIKELYIYQQEKGNARKFSERKKIYRFFEE